MTQKEKLFLFIILFLSLDFFSRDISASLATEFNIRYKGTLTKSTPSGKNGLWSEEDGQSKTKDVVRHMSSFIFGQESKYQMN